VGGFVAAFGNEILDQRRFALGEQFLHFVGSDTCSRVAPGQNISSRQRGSSRSVPQSGIDRLTLSIKPLNLQSGPETRPL
jgi:hypothetical protein